MQLDRSARYAGHLDRSDLDPAPTPVPTGPLPILSVFAFAEWTRPFRGLGLWREAPPWLDRIRVRLAAGLVYFVDAQNPMSLDGLKLIFTFPVHTRIDSALSLGLPFEGQALSLRQLFRGEL
jgi:hypothetical protein